jgi:hypothetical protein
VKVQSISQIANQKVPKRIERWKSKEKMWGKNNKNYRNNCSELISKIMIEMSIWSQF